MNKTWSFFITDSAKSVISYAYVFVAQMLVNKYTRKMYIDVYKQTKNLVKSKKKYEKNIIWGVYKHKIMVYNLLMESRLAIRRDYMNVNLEYYKIFYHVATEHSITGAAKKLCISQPAVSQAVKQLEQGLGIELFTRRAKGVSLTRAGTLLYSYVGNGYETILAGEQQLTKMMNLEYGEVRIGASDMTLQFYLLPYLEKFHQLYPEIKVTVTNAPTPQTIDHLNQGRIDFGVVTKPVEVDSQFDVFKVRKIQDVFVAGDRFQDLQGQKLDYSILEKLPLICLEGDTSTRAYVNSYLEKNNVEVTPEFELATSEMIVQFAKRNLGIGCVVRDFAREQLENGQLFELQFKKRIPERDMCLIIDNRNSMSVAATKLRELLESEMLHE